MIVPAHLAIAGAYYVIPAVLLRLATRYDVPGRRLFPLGAAFVLSGGIGHTLEAFDSPIAVNWHWVTAGISWAFAGVLISRGGVLLRRIAIIDRIFAVAPIGLAVFESAIAADGRKDLRVLSISPQGRADSNGQLVPGRLLGEELPGHRNRLLAEYLAAFDKPILNRVIRHEDDRDRGVGGYFQQSIVPLGRDALLFAWLDVSDREESAQQLKETQAALRHQANHDTLTDCLNRYAISKISDDEAHGVLMINLDRFKAVNDSMGYSVGDLLLKWVAMRIQACLGTELFARYGGDEFVAIADRSVGLRGLCDLAEEIVDSVSRPYQFGREEIRVGCSVGVADGSAGGLDAQVEAAGLALRVAKADRDGPRVVPWDKGQIERTRRNERIGLALRSEVASGSPRFELHYQPIISFSNPQHTEGAEALLRWNSPSLGPVPPNDFIPIAEQLGEMRGISDWVINEAADAIARWTHLSISINLSSPDLERSGFLRRLHESFQARGADISHLGLEITERTIARDWLYLLEVLSELQASRVSIKVDDFGTGYSGLESLLKIVTKISALKIDRGLIPEDANDHGRVGLVKGIVEIAKGCGLHTVAEGVETHEQFCLLRDMGIDAAQGWLFARAMPADEFERWLKGRAEFQE